MRENTHNPVGYDQNSRSLCRDSVGAAVSASSSPLRDLASFDQYRVRWYFGDEFWDGLTHYFMHIRTVVEQLGYSPNEALVYLAALELGGSATTEIADKVKLPRTSVGLIIETLHKKGLMNTYLVRRRKVWVAENPEKLLITLHEREAALKVVLPQLQLLRRDTGAKPTIRAYSGVEEIKQVMADMIEAKHHLLAIVSWDDWVELLGRQFLDDFIETRQRHYLKIRMLAPRTKLSLSLKEKDREQMRVTQFLPEFATIKNSNFIYGNKVAIISLNKKRPTGVLIEDEDIHHTMEVLFESLWRESSGA